MATKKHKALSTDSPDWEAMFEQATAHGKRRAAREPRANGAKGGRPRSKSEAPPAVRSSIKARRAA
jgi:hypothetical protein